MNIVIEGESFPYARINNLPQDLTLKNAKTQDMPDGVAFQSCHAPMSNLYECHVPYDNYLYDSTERGFQHQLALRCDQDDLAEEILKLDTPYDCMIAGKRIKKSRDIEESEEDLMYELNEVKLRTMLSSTLPYLIQREKCYMKLP